MKGDYKSLTEMEQDFILKEHHHLTLDEDEKEDLPKWWELLQAIEKYVDYRVTTALKREQIQEGSE